MDIVMPGMNGFEATRVITRDPETSHIPIVIISTKGQETDKAWGMRQGAKGVHGEADCRERVAREAEGILAMAAASQDPFTPAAPDGAGEHE